MDKKKLTIQEFINKYQDKELKKVKVTEIEVEGYGLIEFVRPKESVIVNYISNITKVTKINNEKGVDGIDFKSLLSAAEEFVYRCCPILQDKEIRASFPDNEPYEIPTLVFGSDMTLTIAVNLIDIFNGKKVKKETEQAIKN